MKNYFTHIFRSSPLPLLTMPLSCRSLGRIQAVAGWKSEIKHRKPRPIIELFWTVSGNALFEIAKHEYRVGPGDVCMYFPRDRHIFSVEAGEWECRWLTVDGTLALKIVKGLGLKREPHYAGICPVKLFDRLAIETADASSPSQRSAAVSAFEILSLAAEHPAPSNCKPRMVDRCIESMFKNFADPSFNVNKLALLMGVHRSILSRTFSGEKEITLSSYLQMLRIEHALSLLKESNLSVREIAERCGFSSQNYFIQTFHRIIGETPSRFRNAQTHS